MQATYQVYLPQGGPLGEKLRFSWLDDDDVKVGDPRSVAGAGLQWEGEKRIRDVNFVWTQPGHRCFNETIEI